MTATLEVQFAAKIKNAEENYINNKKSEEKRLKTEEILFAKDNLVEKQRQELMKLIYCKDLENQMAEKERNRNKEIDKDRHFLKRKNYYLYTDDNFK